MHAMCLSHIHALLFPVSSLAVPNPHSNFVIICKHIAQLNSKPELNLVGENYQAEKH